MTKASLLVRALSVTLGWILVNGSVAMAQTAVPALPALAGAPIVRLPASGKTPDFGTSKLTYIQVGGVTFVPMASPSTFSTTNSGYSGQVLRTTSTPAAFGFFAAPIVVPSGALVRSVELDYCDNTGATGYVQGALITSDSLGNVTGTPQFINSDGTGCKAAIADITAQNIVSNNLTQHHWLVALVGYASGYDVGLAGMKVGYQLQVSPGPATATFLDVPTTSPLFKFVEALVSAGVTAGCGGGNFCPNQPVTRGQMAVFLASALGLEFQ